VFRDRRFRTDFGSVWHVRQLSLIVSYRRWGTGIGPKSKGQYGNDRRSTNFGNCKSTQRNVQQKRRLHLHHGVCHKPQKKCKIHPVSEVCVQHMTIIFEVVCEYRIGPSTKILKRLWQVPVEHCYLKRCWNAFLITCCTEVAERIHKDQHVTIYQLCCCKVNAI